MYLTEPLNQHLSLTGRFCYLGERGVNIGVNFRVDQNKTHLQKLLRRLKCKESILTCHGYHFFGKKG